MLFSGYRAIRRGDRMGHARRMLLAGLLAGLFLAFYLAKAYLFGPEPYRGPEFLRPVYLGVLVFHSVLAALNLPLALFVFWLALGRRYHLHRRVAPWALRVWLWVAVTGWLVYGFLRL